MGNNNSCIPRISVRPTARVVTPDGSSRHVTIPATAAELMLDTPGHVVACRGEVTKARRVVGMRADEQLAAGEVYMLVPKGQVGSRVDDRRLEVMYAGTVGPGGLKDDVVAADEERDVNRAPGEEAEVVRKERFCYWKPFLDTIPEASLEFLTLYMLMQMDSP